MSLVSNIDSCKNDIAFYLPHHAVVNENKVTTKLRVVFDGSAKTNTGLSLNTLLHVGPSLQQELFLILVRFRTYQYVVSADISKMYRQIEIHPDDRKYQQILWREDCNNSLQTYQLNTVTYGTTSAPYLAIRCLKQLGLEATEMPCAQRAILEDFYVDDLLTGADTIEEMLQLRNEIDRILRNGCFHLAKWASNDKRLIPEFQMNESNDVNFDRQCESKILGLLWNTEKDILKYSNNYQVTNNKVTKRVILSNISKIYDPLGLVGPIIVTIKILLQTLWQLQIGWDESVPLNVFTIWQQFCKDLPTISTYSIPRRVVGSPRFSTFEIHGFCDASQRAYGACIYIKTVSNNSLISSHLLCSKSKVAPIKTISIPRLELCAALLLTRLMNKIIPVVNIKPNKISLYSDSTIVLAWLKIEPSKLKTFVANRVSIIQTNTDANMWNHVSTNENPADIISRGTLPSELANLDMWWHGPQFLMTLKYETPVQPNTNEISEIPDLKSTQTKCFLSNTTLMLPVFDKISSFRRLCHIIAYYENGLLRVGGRLRHSSLSFDTKHQVILPKHKLTAALIRDEHTRLLHSGQLTTLNSLRQRYWPIAGRDQIKKVLRQCIKCYKVNPIASEQIMGNLPFDRVSAARPFIHCGVDYAGPLSLKEGRGRGKRLIKGYISLFICLATKAVHLELVGDMTTDSFLGAVKRLISRRGHVTDFYSDNGTNFVGADREFQKLMRSESLKNKLNVTAQNINWHFIPPRAPHHGGLWEASIKLIKHNLKRVVGNANLTFEEMYTVLTGIEACINSRPITPISNDPHDLTALSPSHFLIGDILVAPIESDVTTLKINTLSRWQLVDQIKQHYWRRWQREYLHHLQQRTKWKCSKADIVIGDMVLIKEENLPPLQWSYGRVLDIHRGSDEKVRVVIIKTKGGVMKRPITKICVLPIDNH
ncbi:uncharacterized protein LOC116175453 [Photinus pyralis]|uniref:uncharacterized protein LOC116175453 n=1 Tax=Photinus pyralis TaxID=7054 RepID=UPI00126781BD|nr:uncharacterized protein LOC116175453 [Photinus pyralis]